MNPIRIAAVAAIVFAATLGLTQPAGATEPVCPASPWVVRDWNPAPVAPASSDVIGPHSVELTKPAGTVGTSIETTDLGVTTDETTTLSVSYELLNGATVDAGAIRLFFYDHPDGDTQGQAPTAFIAADIGGALSLTVPAGTHVGTVGLTYDASNLSAGTVRFSGLAIGDSPVQFTSCDAPPEGPQGEPGAEGPRGPRGSDGATRTAPAATPVAGTPGFTG